jgi:hypothetical protein
LNHENNILKAQIDLYVNYISFFQISQQKQIKRLFDNYNEFNSDIDSNLNADQAFSFDDINNDHNFTELDNPPNDTIPPDDNTSIKESVNTNHSTQVELNSSPDNSLKVIDTNEIPVLDNLNENTFSINK